MALNFVLAHSARIHAAAIWNGNFSQGLLGRLALAILAWERFRLGSDMPSRILPRLTFQAWGKAVPNHKTLFDWLSRDEAEVAKYIADPLCGWDASVSMWRDVVNMTQHGGKDSSFAGVRRDLCVNLVGGEKDPGIRLRQGGQPPRETHARDGLFESGFKGLRRNPPRKPERGQSGHRHE